MKSIGPNLVFMLLLLIPHMAQAQEAPEKQERQPEIKWDVQKQLDENGNVIRYDSTYSWSWSSHDPGDRLLDSLFEEFFGDYRSGDSLFVDPFGSMPRRFRGPGGFPDSLFFAPFGQMPHSFLDPGDFPDAFMFPGFPDPMEWMKRQQEMFERFYEMHPFRDDSLFRFRYEQQFPDERRQRFPKEIDT